MKKISLLLIFLPFFLLLTFKNVKADTYISDCSVLNVSGETYYLTSDIINSPATNCMEIQANNVVLDCQGHLIDGKDSSGTVGIRVYRSSATTTNVTIRNCVLSDWHFNVYLVYSDNNTLENIVSSSALYQGIEIWRSNNNNIINCTTNNNSNAGILLYGSVNNRIVNLTSNDNSNVGLFISTNSYNNQILNSRFSNNLVDLNITPSSDLDCNNYVENVVGTNNLPIKYFNYSTSLSNEILSELILCNADYSSLNNITIYSGSLKNGLIVLRTDNSNFTKINSSYNYYAFLSDLSNNNQIIDSVFHNNSFARGVFISSGNNYKIANSVFSNNPNGLSIMYSNNSEITNSSFTGSSSYGLAFIVSNNNRVSNSNIYNNNYGGISVYQSNNNEIINCNVDNNTQWGVNAQYSNNNTFINSSFTNNQNGVYVGYSNNNTFINSSFTNNQNYGIELERSLYNQIINSNTSNNNGDGLLLYTSSNYTKVINHISNNNRWGIRLSYSSNCIINSVIANNNTYHGIYLSHSNYNQIINATSYYNGYNGIYILSVSNYNQIVNCSAGFNNRSGIIIEADIIGSPNYNQVVNCISEFNAVDGIFLEGNNHIVNNSITRNNNYYGILLYGNYSQIYNNVIQDNTNSGIYLYSSYYNKIYNNLFNNTNNFIFSGTNINYWNTTKQIGTRIYSDGIYIGGNYWTNSTGNGYSDTCNDTDRDGFCDDPYVLASNNIDYLPYSNEYVEAKIVNVEYPSVVGLNETYTFRITIKNMKNTTSTFVIGMSIGYKWYNGDFTIVKCNEYCYVGGYDVDAYGRKWVEFVVNLPPLEQWTGTVDYQFKSEIFAPAKYYDLVVRLWKDIRNVRDFTFDEYGLDQAVFLDAIYVAPFAPTPPYIDAQIVGYTFPSEAYQEDVVTFGILVKNTGNVSHDFYVGLSVGNSTSGIWCNRDCYADGLGDYAIIRNLEQGSTVYVERKFKLRKDFFDYNKRYDVRIAVYDRPYLPFNMALDSIEVYSAILVKELRPFAYAFDAKADKATVGHGSLITITAWITNNGTVPYNFTLGMSIGIWDVEHKKIYPYPQTALILPCNVECYRDGLGDWVYIYIPPNFTVPFVRTFEVPSYFLANNSFDVAVGVWKVGGVDPISMVYFKNISFVSLVVPPEVATKYWGQSLVDNILDFIGTSLRVNREYSKMVFWVALSCIMGMTVMAVPAYITKSLPPWQVGVLAIALMVVIGAIITDTSGSPYMPAWIALIFVIIASFIVARYGREVIFGAGGA